MKKDLDPGDDLAPERADGSSDLVEELLRATGRRPAVPADRADRVQAAVKAHWQAEVRRHARRRTSRWAAALAVAASIGAVAGLAIWRRADVSSRTRALAVVEMVFDSAWSQPASDGRNISPLALRPGDEVKVGSELATEAHGRLALRLAAGHSVRLDVGTRVRVLSDRAIALDRGAVYVDSRGPDGAAVGSIEIHTPLGDIRDIGTQFEARWLAASVRVRVREGKLTVDGGAGSLTATPFLVTAGQELEIGQDGRISRHDLTAFGAEWDWVGEITPMLELEGRSLQEFLDWIARERGLRLRYARSDAAAAARGIVLNGSIHGMTLDQALESVLPTCRMLHRIEGDVLLIQPSEPPQG